MSLRLCTEDQSISFPRVLATEESLKENQKTNLIHLSSAPLQIKTKTCLFLLFFLSFSGMGYHLLDLSSRDWDFSLFGL